MQIIGINNNKTIGLHKMAFSDFLNEAKGNKRLGAKNFEAIIIMTHHM